MGEQFLKSDVLRRSETRIRFPRRFRITKNIYSHYSIATAVAVAVVVLLLLPFITSNGSLFLSLPPPPPPPPPLPRTFIYTWIIYKRVCVCVNIISPPQGSLFL